MRGWNPTDHNPLTDAPKSPRIEPDRPDEPADTGAVTLNGNSVTLPWPFLVAEADDAYPSVDILTD